MRVYVRCGLCGCASCNVHLLAASLTHLRNGPHQVQRPQQVRQGPLQRRLRCARICSFDMACLTESSPAGFGSAKLTFKSKSENGVVRDCALTLYGPVGSPALLCAAQDIKVEQARKFEDASISGLLEVKYTNKAQGRCIVHFVPSLVISRQRCFRPDHQGHLGHQERCCL